MTLRTLVHCVHWEITKKMGITTGQFPVVTTSVDSCCFRCRERHLPDASRWCHKCRYPIRPFTTQCGRSLALGEVNIHRTRGVLSCGCQPEMLGTFLFGVRLPVAKPVTVLGARFWTADHVGVEFPTWTIFAFGSTCFASPASLQTAPLSGLPL